MGKDKAIKVWETISKDYSKLIIPNRPSHDDCRIYGVLTREALRSRKQPKIMIMGATPELRRVLYTAEFLQKAEVFCVDVNPVMYKAMNNFLMKGHFNERFKKQSWLDTKFDDKFFDLVIGDEVICNISPDKHQDLFKEISQILKDNGHWITRHNLYTEKVKKTSVGEIFAEISEKIEKGEYDFQLAINILYSKIFYYMAWKNPGLNSMAGHLKIMKQEYEKNLKKHKFSRIIRELINLYQENFVSLSGNYRWHVLSEKESEKELKEYFVIQEKMRAGDYPTVEYSPIYLLKKC